MFRRIELCVCALVFSLLIPCLAHAQDYADKFGGLYVGGDILVGMGPVDTCFENSVACYQNDYDKYIENHKNDGLQRYIINENNTVGGLAQFSLGYLFGRRVFVGPELAVSGGYPMLFNVDARVRFVAPLVDAHAINLALGIGYNPVRELNTSKYVGVESMYVPMQVGYDYTFDNGFTLGMSFQLNLSFADDQKRAVDPETNVKYWEETGTMAYIGFWGLGIHLGYRFGHHE